MFDQSKAAQEMFNLSKNYWATTMEMLSSFQDQNEKMFHTMLEQGIVAQGEGKKMLQEWMNRARQARDQFQRTMEDNWKRAETVFGSTSKSTK